EWIYRITQDPWRLWKRYFVGFFKFGLMMLPAVLYYRFKRLLYSLYHKKVSIPTDSTSRTRETLVADLKMINVPDTLDAAVVKTVRDEFERIVSHPTNTVLDFSQTDFIDSSGIGLLVSLRRKAVNVQKELFIIGIKSSTRRFLKLSRILDLFKDRIFNTLNEVTAFIKEKSDLPSFYYFNIVRPEDVIFHLIGILDAAQMAALDVEAVIKEIGNKDCIFNLMDLTFIDSSGIMFFLKIQKHVAKQEKVCLLFGMQDNVKQMFRITKLDRLFKITQDMLSAEKLLEETRNR
ncbi:MAG: STAS domain-containing protein, partial [Desulfobacterales bacterium]